MAGEYDPPAAVAERLARLAGPLRILDLGANVGLFAASCLERWPDAQIVAVEPDPENLQLLERMASQEQRIEVIPACAAAHDGKVRFLAGLFAESQVVEDAHEGKTIELPCVDAFRLAESTDLIKIDIEGSEWEILADPRLSELGVTALVMEWHDKSCPHDDPVAQRGRRSRGQASRSSASIGRCPRTALSGRLDARAEAGPGYAPRKRQAGPRGRLSARELEGRSRLLGALAAAYPVTFEAYEQGSADMPDAILVIGSGLPGGLPGGTIVLHALGEERLGAPRPVALSRDLERPLSGAVLSDGFVGTLQAIEDDPLSVLAAADGYPSGSSAPRAGCWLHQRRPSSARRSRCARASSRVAVSRCWLSFT